MLGTVHAFTAFGSAARGLPNRGFPYCKYKPDGQSSSRNRRFRMSPVLKRNPKHVIDCFAILRAA